MRARAALCLGSPDHSAGALNFACNATPLSGSLIVSSAWRAVRRQARAGPELQQTGSRECVKPRTLWGKGSQRLRTVNTGSSKPAHPRMMSSSTGHMHVGGSSLGPAGMNTSAGAQRSMRAPFQARADCQPRDGSSGELPRRCCAKGPSPCRRVIGLAWSPRRFGFGRPARLSVQKTLEGGPASACA